MDDLIDRKELLRAIRNFSFNICCARATGKYRTSRMQYKMYTAIQEQFLLIAKGIPKADTERHAHWIIQYDMGEPVGAICSYCENEISYDRNEMFDIQEELYCHKCGCRMDEVKEQ